MDATLTVVHPDGRIRDVPLTRPRVLLGRKPDCNIRIPALSVSREHCEILVQPPRLIVRDLGSSNGTFVNRQRVREAELAAGDILTVGPAVFVVRINGQPATVDARAAHALAGATAHPAARKPATAAPSPALAQDSSVDFDFDEFLTEDENAPKL